MYDTKLTRISLPSENYRLLLGTALSVFSSNNSFIIENIIHEDNTYSWYYLIDKQSGDLKEDIRKTISAATNDLIGKKFDDIVKMRNRIIHAFRITSEDNEQIMATKEMGTHKQFQITEDYLIEFIRLNDELSNMLHDLRGY